MREAAAQGLDIEVLTASDGRHDQRFRSKLMPSRHPHATCADLIGAIFDSHRRAWEEAMRVGGPVLVLEDDVTLPGNFSKILARRMKELPPSYDLAMLCTTSVCLFSSIEGLTCTPSGLLAEVSSFF